MAPLSTNAISHFLHPAHKLNHLTTNTSSSYICDGCQVVGTGSRYTCTPCDFDLHDYCAKCPTRLTSSMSHPHPMSLVVHKSIPNLTESCQICPYPIKGLAYQCKDCNFWVHPLCVSTNSGDNQVNTARSRSVPASQPAAQGIVEQIGVGLVTNAIYDVLKPDENDSSNAAGPSAGLDTSGAGGDEGGFIGFGLDTSGAGGDEGGFIGFLKSIFESSSDK